MRYDAIIIGAGLGGLTAGAKLAKQGKKVLMLEQHIIPGGCATTFKRKGYTLEVGLHEMDGLDDKDLKTDIFNELGVFENIEFVPLPQLCHYKNTDMEMVIPEGREEAISLFNKRFPSEKEGLRKFFDTIYGIRNEMYQMGNAMRNVNTTYGSKEFSLPSHTANKSMSFKYIIRNSRISVGHFLDKYIKDDHLKLVLTANLGYYHDDPYTMSMLYFASAQAGYFEGGYFIKGGSQKLSDYLASCITNAGGEIIYRHLANDIIVENGKAIGVKYQKNSRKETETFTAYADVVVANTAIPNVVGMLPETEASLLKNKIDGLKPSCSMLTLYLCFKRPPKAFGHNAYSTYITNIKSLKSTAEQLQFGQIAEKPITFVDYGQIDSGLAPEGKSVGVLTMSDYVKNWNQLSKKEYKDRKKVVSEIMIDRLESLIPGIKNEIEHYELGTAKTIERYTMNPNGTIYGYQQTPQQAGLNRIDHKSPIDNLYFASAWTFPGGGFTGAIISGYLCALKIL